MNCNGIDDYEEEKTVISLEDDEEHQVEAVKEGPILRRSKRIAGLPADGPSVGIPTIRFDRPKIGPSFTAST